ncbi:MAG: DNA topoisomerase 4 subunit A [Clostridia bacterium]|nr:DNA topoisomerase 4 subunit A [Clostridia bacterium]MDY4083615.1 DNA topoisomerase (ATP-hydrolyzing) [Eubacteriales bacterium]
MAKKNEIIEDKSRILEGSVEDIIHNSMIPYSEYVILDRALPRVEDGLKPVQRRILYTMLELGITPDKPHRKCARIVGDCLGKYHPHGDSSVYEALVRLAQDFSVRSTLVDGHGNFGSVDGDSAAAMRYTEARLTPLAMELLRDLDKDTVPMSLNFDDSLEEPDILPGRYPNLLVNGTSGIAVGLATNIPPHNLGEVIDGVIAYIDNPDITLKEMMNYIPAPDFPTGGIIIDSEEIYKAYETGKGRIITRARTHIEKDGDKQNIVITEIPFGIKKSTLLQGINALRESKKEVFGVISDIVDESDRSGMRCVIKLKKDADAERILASLFKTSKMESACCCNMVAIANGKPQQMGLLDIISFYVEYQREIIYKRSQYEINAAKKRAHVLEGLLIAVANIREVVDIVLSSKTYNESRERLRERFELSDKQAVAVLDVPLKRLNKLDVDKMKEELDALKEKIKELDAIINSKRRQLAVVKKEIGEIKKKYNEPRKSTIVAEHETISSDIDLSKIKLERKGFIVLGYEGEMRFLTEKSYAMASKSIVNCTAPNLARQVLPCTNDGNILGFTDKGNCVVFSLDDLPDDKWKSKGTAISKISKADSDEKLVAIFNPKDIKGKELYMMTKNGMVKRTAGDEFSADKKMLAPAIVLKDGDVLRWVEIKREDSGFIFFATEQGMALNAQSDDIPLQGRKASGVRGVMLGEGDSVVYASQNDGAGEIVVIMENGLCKRIILPEIEPTKRFRKGVKLFDNSVGSAVFVGLVTYPYDIALVGMNKECVAINTEDIPIDKRTSKGKNILKLKAKEIGAMIVIDSARKHNI